MNILCKLGMHKWSKTRTVFHFESNVKDCEQYCMRCGKIKKWNEPV